VRAVLLGAPGCGKGTQAERLETVLGVPAISTGDLLRQEVAQRTALGDRVAATMASGQLVGDDLMGDVVRSRLQRDDARGGFLLDGYPRTTGQAKALDDILDQESTRLDAVIHLEVGEDVLVRRALARRRADDAEPVIRERLAVYREKTAPLIDHYRERGLLRTIDGNRPVEQVTLSILAAIDEA